jgi:inner membrane protein
MVSGRLVAESSRMRLFFAIAGMVGLAMLPDIDAVWCGLGIRDAGLIGHRGFTHTPAFALLVGAVAGLVAARRRWGSGWRVALVVALVVLSHGVLDGLAQDGRGIMVFWPLSRDRYHFPWRPLPDAPTGLAMLSRRGLATLFIEMVYFSPFTVYALSPRPAATAAAGETPPLRAAFD